MTEVLTKDMTANPAPIGLLGFGMTTVMLNLHNAGFFGLNTMILGLGIFYGGLAQLIAGLMEWKKGNTFACTAFVSYGAFWLSLVGLIVMSKTPMGIDGPNGTAMSFFLAMWGVLTLFLFVGTFKLNRALQVVFGTLVLLFFLLAYGEATGDKTLSSFTGYEGIFCGASAIYTAMAQVLNDVFGKVVLPIGPMIS
ncbi:acetate uptake transporter [Limnobacter litoralis]|uniref:GPR1/FUN34/yaaH family protein n=1 Tax=Limnobacter litoralis TaxID=481366 RepID=A0ABQ5YRC3_9BURK|nr:acetate uptake transporter [Limnobacter litoralis]GLR27144.1 hypothetical protein GCM10007875_22350 [Limnobacter litoralis]